MLERRNGQKPALVHSRNNCIPVSEVDNII